MSMQGSTSPEGPAAATVFLHYLAPFVTVGYFALASTWSVIALQPRDGTLRKRLKRAILALSGFVFLSFVAEAICIITQILGHSGPFATQDNNVYALSGSLVWILLLGCVFGSDDHEWYPYYGSWALALVFDLTAFILRLTSHRPSSAVEWVQAGLQLNRVVDMAFLFAVYFLRGSPPKPMSDEETTPLLGQPDDRETQTPSRKNHQPSTEESAVSDAIEREEAKRDKKRKEKQEKLNEKLREHPNWFAYLREYVIFFPYIWPTNNPKLLWNMAGVGLCLVAQRVLNVLGPRQLGILTNYLNAGAPSPAFNALVFYVLFNLLKSSAGLNGLQRVLWIRVERNARMCLDEASYAKIMELSCDFHDDKQSGELFAQMRQGASLVDLLETCLYDIGPLVTDLVVAFFYFWILFDSYLVLIAAATVIAFLWVSIFFTSLQVEYRRKHVIRMRRKMQYQHDTMSSWRTVTYFNRIPHVERMYAMSVNKSMDTWTKLSNLYNGGSALKSLVLETGRFGALIFAVYQVMYNGKDVGSFMVLLTYWSQFSNPLQFLASTQRQLLDNLVDAEELRSLFRREPSVKDGSKEAYIDKAEVEFDNVSFSYGEGSDIIKGLSFRADAGKKIALIGETGAGKSTVLKLLFRLYDVTGGSIRIDSQNVQDMTLSSLREEIGVVPQDPSLFNDTIMANLRFGKLDITPEEAEEACKAAAVHDQIMKFPDGYNSVVGERGVKLSGGEKQRIAIARAILKRPSLILLDEATSSVDNETEEKIQEGLARLCKDRTTIVIAHRLSTIMDADLILVLKDGQILEQGTPKDLLRRKGKYYSLWSKQVGIIDAMNEVEEESKRILEKSGTTPSEESKLLTYTDGAADTSEKVQSDKSSSSTATGDPDDVAVSQSQNSESAVEPGSITTVESSASGASGQDNDANQPAPDATNGMNNISSTRSLSFSVRQASIQTPMKSIRGGSGRGFRPEAPVFIPRHAISSAQTPPASSPTVRLPTSSSYGVSSKQASSDTKSQNGSDGAAIAQADTTGVVKAESTQNMKANEHQTKAPGAAEPAQGATTGGPSLLSVAGNEDLEPTVQFRRPHAVSRRGISHSEPAGDPWQALPQGNITTTTRGTTADCSMRCSGQDLQNQRFGSTGNSSTSNIAVELPGRGVNRRPGKTWQYSQRRASQPCRESISPDTVPPDRPREH